MGGVVQDLRYGLRGLVRARGFALASVAILGLGIGATTVMYSALHAVLFAPLPFESPERLVSLWERNPDFGWEQAAAAPANVLDWRERVEAFQDVAMYQETVGHMTWTDGGEPRRLGVTLVSGNFFELLGVRAVHGQLPSWEDTWSGPERRVVVSWAFFQEALGGDPDAVGRTLTLNDAPARVEGVLPAGVSFPAKGIDLWTPYGWLRESESQAWFRRAHFVTPVARLRDGVTAEQARAELEAVALQLQEEHPELNANMFAGLSPFRSHLVGGLAQPLKVLMAGVGLLLLVACVNVGNLFAVRAVARRREISVRRVLGAPVLRVVRQLLAEGLVVGVAAGVFGILLAVGGIEMVERLRPIGVSGATAMSVDGAVLGFAALVSLLSVLFFALGPAVHAAGGELATRLRSGTPGAMGSPGGLGRWMVPLQLALAVVLALGAGLVTRSFSQLRSQDAGIDPSGVHLFELSAPSARYPDFATTLAFWDRVLEQVDAIPGVERSAVVSGIPLTFSGWTSQVMARNWSPEDVAFEVRHRSSTPAYFETMGVPILRGRGFNRLDRDGAPVAIVNQRFVDLYFQDQDPVGAEITFDRVPDENSVWRTIVGVVGSERQGSLSLPADAEVWEPMAQDMARDRIIVLKTAEEVPGLGQALREAVGRVDPMVPVAGLRRMTEVVDASAADARFLLVLFNTFGGLALILAAAGIYGVTAQTVRRRIPEYGLRMALGAGGAAVAGLVVRRIVPAAGAGVAAGVVLGLAAAGTLERLLFQVPPRDPLTFLAVPAILLGVALGAAWLPARRAARVSPTESLRSD